MEKGETISSSKLSKPADFMTLQKAIDLGEYDPGYLSTFPEWQMLSPHVQLQHIKQGLDNRERQLITQWAEVVNVIDFSKKPLLQVALRNIEKQLKKVHSDRERYYLEYSSK